MTPEPRQFRILVLLSDAGPDAVRAALQTIGATDPRGFDEVHLVATARIATQLRDTFFATARSRERFIALCASTRVARRDFTTGRRLIHEIGKEHDRDAGTWADAIVDILRPLCASPGSVVTVATTREAGLLGILFHSALGLIGRPQDKFVYLEARGRARLSVTPTRRRVAGKRVRPSPLIEVPHVLAERVLPAQVSFQHFARTRLEARLRLEQPGVFVLDARTLSVRVDDIAIVLPKGQFFWLYVLASTAPDVFPLRAMSSVNPSTEAHRYAHLHGAESNHLLRLIGQVKKTFIDLFPRKEHEFAATLNRACGPTPGLPSLVSKINRSITNALGLGAQPYLITGGRGHGGYRLTLQPSRIKIIAPSTRRPIGVR